ncbi:hypothetical protein G4B88_003621 [Cannabis sativa]|uniref:Uncharacterized protein n=1 Tax=Cannabis sativa TaxID=3483 RepID=A0A7J6FDN5_CANSA|nr:hypothetical protein G4B88_003621 [Cannabis sativa]
MRGTELPLNQTQKFRLQSRFASLEKVKEVEEFFATRSKPAIARTLKQSIERVKINAKWVESIHAEKNLADAVTEFL